MNIEALRCLISAVRHGSLSGAARTLGLPKSTVLNRINALEAQLGARLLERTPRIVRPTAEALVLCAEGEHLLRRADDLERAFRDRDGAPKGTLRISVPVMFEQEHIGLVAARYLARHPQVRFEVVAEDRRVDVLGEGFDCAVRTGELDDSSMIAVRFATTRNLVVAAPALLERLGRPGSPEALAEWPVVWVGSRAGHHAWTLGGTEGRKPVPLNPVAFLSSIQAARQAAIEGAGAALIPGFYLRSDVEAGRLVALSDNWNTLEVPVSVIYPAHRQPYPRVRALVALLKEIFRTQ